jgi:hypothetical protein
MTKPYQYFLTSQLALTMVPAPVGREVVKAVPDNGIPFFLSYARANSAAGSPDAARYSDQMAERFFMDLQENVAQLVVRGTGAEIGFMDTRMQAGTHCRMSVSRLAKAKPYRMLVTIGLK